MSVDNVQRVKASELDLKEKVVSINRVAKVTKGGRTFGFSALVVVGDANGIVGHGLGKAREVTEAISNGIVGHGLGKAREVTEAISKGIDDAKKNLIKVPVLQGTIPHDQRAKYRSSKVMLKPASSGTGVIAGGAMRAVLESAGIKDILAKSLGSSNPHNVVKATIEALTLLRDPITVSKQRRIKLQKIFKG